MIDKDKVSRALEYCKENPLMLSEMGVAGEVIEDLMAEILLMQKEIDCLRQMPIDCLRQKPQDAIGD